MLDVSPTSGCCRRGLPAAVAPRTVASPGRLSRQPQRRQQPQQAYHQQAAPPPSPQPQPPQRQPQRQQQHPVVHAASPQVRTSPVLEALAAVTADAFAAASYNESSPFAALSSGAAPPLPRPTVTGVVATGSTSPSSALVTAAAAAAAAGSAVPAVAAAVGGPGGNAPPPRALVPMQMAGGRVVMVPEGVEPGLAAAVLRDAVTWDTGVSFDDIAGCERAKQLLHEAVALPLIIPEFFTGIREPWRGVLLHGPPGTGKTMLAKAVAGMVGGAFFAVSPASLTSKWRGESEKLLAALFAVAQAHAPSIIFIDEMDGLASGRGVMVLAATNCPWDLDPALRRRLEKRIHIGLPDAPQRLALLRLHLRGVALAADVDLPSLAAGCEGLSGADVRLLCRDAAMAPLRRQLGALTAAPAVSPPDLELPLAQRPDAVHGSPAAPASSLGPGPGPAPAASALRTAADIRRLADSGELARGAVVCAADLAAARAAVRPSVSAQQAARYEEWDREFASA
ncbi:hypothetical protein GPECTOR_60g713 [Gonium pectorale]|uniref:AAA+ ATPase domain-containing protein n=1 Tax=Gonium pectorale TaxID=33097 RepID=A0A150G4X4_GONPE|nr:hypothetical protein GPECTOR_60g713 [Gonium pectorale]|eukprot:KXZ44936.1 hypothetical protein GPECTOR_60g713 [Gonium pectorale]